MAIIQLFCLSVVKKKVGALLKMYLGNIDYLQLSKSAKTTSALVTRSARNI